MSVLPLKKEQREATAQRKTPRTGRGVVNGTTAETRGDGTAPPGRKTRYWTSGVTGKTRTMSGCGLPFSMADTT